MSIDGLAISKMNTCQATNADGTPCRMAAGADGFCFQHSPSRATERDAARRRGGLRRAGKLARATLATLEGLPPELKSPDAVRALLDSVIGHTLTGTLDCRVAATVGTLAGVILKAMESGELAERLEALEAAVEQNRRGCA